MLQLFESVTQTISQHASGLTLVILFLNLLLLLILVRFLKKQPSKDTRIDQQLAQLDGDLQGLFKVLNEEGIRNRGEASQHARLAREEMSSSLGRTADALLQRLTENAGMQKAQLDSFARQLMALTRLNEEKAETLRKSVDARLERLRDENNRHLERIKETVDEQLHINLEKRVGESFKQVSHRLEQVYRGLGEMQQLANGVGDLKRVLTNVRIRGTWGEVRLAAILEQILTPDQYDANVATGRNRNERVEFALRLPGSSEDRDQVVWLPIDAKFPQEDYQHLLDALERADKESADRYLKQLEMRIRAEAKTIRQKYVAPPRTTDFAIMFLPVEGLYAEILRRPGLCSALQQEYRIVVTGPTTLSALLNSLQIGFRTIAIERRTSEVWNLLEGLKAEFGRFGDALAKTRKKIQEAGNTIDQAEVRSRAISRRLSKVEEMQLTEQKAE